MPIKWSAVKVSEAMDEVEKQVFLADQFIAEAKAKAEEAKKIPNLPQYIEQRIGRLIDQLDRIETIKDAIESVHQDIPDGAIEAEQEDGKHGKTQSLM
jgi:pyoverdine/dityrosine biosynthesis protein Dit1